MSGPHAIGDVVILNHDGPDGLALEVRIERIEGDYIIIDTAAGEYRFLNVDCRLPIPAVSRPDGLQAAKFDTWLMANSEINRGFYDVDAVERHFKVVRELAAIVPKRHFETLRSLINNTDNGRQPTRGGE